MIKGIYKTFAEIVCLSVLSWALVIAIFTYGLRFLVFNYYLFISAVTFLVFLATFIGHWSFASSYHLVKSWPNQTDIKLALAIAKFDIKRIIWLSFFSAIFTAIGFLLFL